jgi:uncharacterized protein (DUF433 family)
VDGQGSIRFVGSRVTLDVIMDDYKAGMPVERIAHGYDTVPPAAVYAAIAYYLRHTAEVEEYLRRRDEEAERLRLLIESTQPPHPSRAELLARMAQRNGGHVAPGS